MVTAETFDDGDFAPVTGGAFRSCTVDDVDKLKLCVWSFEQYITIDFL